MRPFTFLAFSVFVAASAKAVEDKGALVYQQLCSACHGENGGGNFELKSPPTAGLPQWYLALQLERFKNGHRGAHPEDTTGNQMAAIAKALEPDAATAVAGFVSKMEKLPPQPVGDADIVRGKELYMESCAPCHRFNASGEIVFRSPPLRAFPAWYLHGQFDKFKSGQRGAVENDEDGEKMRAIATAKTIDADIRDIIGFITSIATED